MSTTPDINTDLIATCWTSAGDVVPMAAIERSPLAIEERVREVAATGWAGIGIGGEDLRHIHATIGFSALREAIAAAGLRYTEVELIENWWEPSATRVDDVRDLLMNAATELDAIHIKIATPLGAAASDTQPFVAPLRDLADHAAERGVRLALEAMPYTRLSTVPRAADLVRAVDRANLGVLIDSWHVFRAGTTLADLRASLSADIVFGVELDDAGETVVGTLPEDSINERLLCGEGSFDLIGLVRTMIDIGFRGPWGTEIISNAHRALPLRDALDQARRTSHAVILSAVGQPTPA